MTALYRATARLKWAFTPPSRKKRLLEDTMAVLNAIPETRALLDLAKAEGVSITLSGKLSGTQTLGHVLRDTRTGKMRIELAPFGAAQDLAETLIHELRHVWQHKTLCTDLGPGTREEPGAAMAALVTRVKEADAFAFSMAMIRSINYANGADDERPDTRRIMADMFRFAIPALGEYDRRTVRHYHDRYTHPDFEPDTHLPPGEALDVAQLRKILKSGVTPDAPGYLDDLDDEGFTALAMAGMAPGIRETLSLMGAFERVAAKGGLPANDDRNMREHIDGKLRQMEKQRISKPLF